MFLLFGLSTRERVRAQQQMACEVCGWTAAQSLLERRTRFTLFFVPLFPVKPSRYLLVCGHCRRVRDVDSRVAAELADH